MPIYEFKCWYCESVSEELAPLGTERTQCPRCGQYAYKQMSAPRFRVKGYNAINGYNVPTKEDVLNPDGTVKKEWGK